MTPDTTALPADLLPESLRSRVSMLYDGGCPLCSKEVAHYQRIDRDRKVNWIDIDDDTTMLDILGVDKTTAMKHLHVIDTNGAVVRGAFAFAVVWAQLPRYRHLARLVALPGVLPTLNRLYNLFAERRFKSRMRCINNCDNDRCS